MSASRLGDDTNKASNIDFAVERFMKDAIRRRRR
jgi:hypothetical protein